MAEANQILLIIDKKNLSGGEWNDCPVLNPSFLSIPYEQTREFEIFSLVYKLPPMLCHAMPCHVQYYYLVGKERF